MDRFWLLTWTTYGTWLPGDERGSVTRIRHSDSEARQEHDLVGAPYVPSIEGLRKSGKSLLKGNPVYLTFEQAIVAARSLSNTANYRGWELTAGAVMANHVHLVVGVPGDPEPALLLQAFKSYASRALSEGWSKPTSGTWWTESGSRRKLADEAAIMAAVRYVQDQNGCLARCQEVSTGRAGDESPPSM